MVVAEICKWVAVEHLLIFGCFDCGEEAEAVDVDAMADGFRAVAFVEEAAAVGVAGFVDREMVRGVVDCGHRSGDPFVDYVLPVCCCGCLFDDSDC